MQGEKKDKIPAKKTEIENTSVSNKEPTFLRIETYCTINVKICIKFATVNCFCHYII